MKDNAQRMKRITLGRNGRKRPGDVEVSYLKAGLFRVGEHVMLRIKGDCCYGGPSPYEEFEVAGVKPCDAFGGGRETVTFRRVRTRREGGAE